MNQGPVCDLRKLYSRICPSSTSDLISYGRDCCPRIGREGAGEQAASARGRSRGWPGKARLAGAQGGRLGRTIGRPAAGRRSSQRAAQQLRSSGGQSKMQSEGGGGLGQAEGLAGRLVCSSSGHDAAEKEGSGRQ